MRKLLVLLILCLMLFGCEDNNKVKDGTHLDDGVVVTENVCLNMFI